MFDLFEHRRTPGRSGRPRADQSFWQGRNQTGSGLPYGLMAGVFVLYRRCGPGEH
jgi:hypothetical protein